jgi:CHAT domain-containing protein
MAGLAYSFLRAGVPATISTLWDVADEATTDLLIGFHRHLASGESVPQALRVAQLEAMKATDAHSRAPQTWAAFTYTGP